MRRNRSVFLVLAALTLVTLPTLAVGDAPAVPETESNAAEALSSLVEPPVEALCLATMCIDIEVFAHNPETGECRSFPNPCSVPEGWVLGCP